MPKGEVRRRYRIGITLENWILTGRQQYTLCLDVNEMTLGSRILGIFIKDDIIITSP